ncbi:iron-sulfur cluster biosynthesis family protein [Siminovitchia sediminis]|uniref:Iron-sulfur cluster biosynthesis family protein n=1 Tax=Siminovitchia sediminis TaxID=1274353 RepID=A0ABW4KI84_9BACI
MVIRLTEAAVNKLRNMKMKDGHIPRMDANISGGCGMAVSFKFFIDEKRRNDHVFQYNGIQIAMDRLTLRYLNKDAQVDYNEKSGFIVGEGFSSGACAIESNNVSQEGSLDGEHTIH